MQEFITLALDELRPSTIADLLDTLDEDDERIEPLRQQLLDLTGSDGSPIKSAEDFLARAEGNDARALAIRSFGRRTGSTKLDGANWNVWAFPSGAKVYISQDGSVAKGGVGKRPGRKAK